MKYQIVNSTEEDLSSIFELYDAAVALQKVKGAVQWPTFEEGMILSEIKAKQQWKLVIADTIACVWATAENDPLIWGAQDADPSIYLHRIATHPDYRGRNLVREIVSWSTDYARQKGKKYVRMDTVGNNTGLINYYQKCDFDFLGLVKLEETKGLPEHYQKDVVSLFEIEVKRN